MVAYFKFSFTFALQNYMIIVFLPAVIIICQLVGKIVNLEFGFTKNLKLWMIANFLTLFAFFGFLLTAIWYPDLTKVGDGSFSGLLLFFLSSPIFILLERYLELCKLEKDYEFLNLCKLICGCELILLFYFFIDGLDNSVLSLKSNSILTNVKIIVVLLLMNFGTSILHEYLRKLNKNIVFNDDFYLSTVFSTNVLYYNLVHFAVLFSTITSIWSLPLINLVMETRVCIDHIVKTIWIFFFLMHTIATVFKNHVKFIKLQKERESALKKRKILEKYWIFDVV